MSTSSNKLRNRRQNADQLSFGRWEDHYIRPYGECHPDYVAVPMGRVDGPKICIKKKDPCTGHPVSHQGFEDRKYPPEQKYHKFKADMYDMEREEPVQLHNPYSYGDRRMPNESFLIRNDYVKSEIKYDGHGLTPLLTPGDVKFREYAYDYIQDPPPRYDVTRLHQPYPLWKNAQEYHGRDTSNIDKNHHESIGSYV